MKKIATYILALGLIVAAASSCWKEPQFEMGSAVAGRHQVIDLKAVPGDCEVLLSWAVPEGWNATDFQVSYLDDKSEKQTALTGGATSYIVKNLINQFEYTFDVQAIYGKNVSGAVSVTAKPATTRFAVTDLMAEAESGMVTLRWTKPATNVQGYTITYTAEDGTTNKVTVSDKDATSAVVNGLTDDVNYTFSVVANYPNGDSDPVVIKAMPTFAVPYTISTDKTAVGLPVTFTFNRADYASATSVEWKFPGDKVLEGDVVKGAFTGSGTQRVVLSANINGVVKSWNIDIEVREFVVYDNDFPFTAGKYNGFKGSNPVFSPDGKTVYDITFSAITNLIAWDIATGEKKWTYTVEHGSYNGLTVNPVTGDIYFGTQTAGDFFAVTPEGTLKWQFNEAGSMQSASPAVSADGNTVFIIDAAGKTFAINAADGTKKWGVDLGAKGGALLVNGDDLVVAINSTTKTIAWLKTEDGSEIVSYGQNAAAADICAGFAVSPDNRYAYYGHANGPVSKIDLVSRTIVVNAKETGGNHMWGPVCSPNGDVLFGSKDSKVYLLDGVQMEVKKTFDPSIGANNGFNYCRACSDTDGNFYISSGQIKNVNYVLGPDLSLKNSFTVGSDGDKQMGGNNYLDGILYAAYIGKNGDNGKFVGKWVGGTRYMGPGLDICGSSCIKDVAAGGGPVSVNAGGSFKDYEEDNTVVLF